MKLENTAFIIAVVALAVGVIDLLLDMRNSSALANLTGASGNPNAGGFNVTTGAPVFNFGSGGGGVNAAYVAPSGRSSSCGCGGSAGDYAIPAVSPSYADAIRLIPGAAAPTVRSPNDPVLPRLLAS